MIKLQNSSAGLVLAAVVLDLSAFQHRDQAKWHVPNDEVMAGAMAFLWQQARFALPTLLESKASTEAASNCAGLTRNLRSMHHILAARRYTSSALPTCLSHKAASMAAQCVTLAASAPKGPLSSLGEAACDLLLALAGYGSTESALQSFAMTEFSRLATLSSMFVNSLSVNSKGSSRQGHGPSFLALVLRAIAAPLLPLGLYSKDPKDLSPMASERVAAADTRAGHLAAVVIQRSLLEDRSEAMQVLVQQLSVVCGDPFWATAPLYALRLIGALSRVAGASRMIDLDCSQREKATGLLAKMAEALTISAQEAKDLSMTCRACGAEAAAECELCVLKARAPGKQVQGKSKSKDPLALVVTLLDAIPQESLTPATHELQGSALSANDSRCNVRTSELFFTRYGMLRYCNAILTACDTVASKTSERLKSQCTCHAEHSYFTLIHAISCYFMLFMLFCIFCMC